MKPFYITPEHIFTQTMRPYFPIKENMQSIIKLIEPGKNEDAIIRSSAESFLNHVYTNTDPKILKDLNRDRLLEYFKEMIFQEYKLFTNEMHTPFVTQTSDQTVYTSTLTTADPEKFETNETTKVSEPSAKAEDPVSETESEISKIIDQVANRRAISDAHKKTLLKIMNGLEGNDPTYRPRRCVGMIDEFHNLNDAHLELNKLMSIICSYARVYHDDVIPMHESARQGHGNLHDRTYGDEISEHFTSVEDMIQNLLPLHIDTDTGRVSNLKRFMRYYIIPREDIRENISEREINNLLATAVEYIQKKWKCYAFATIMPKCVAFFVTTSEIKYNKNTKRLERNISSPSASGHTNDPKFTHKSLTVGNKSACWNEFIKGVLHEIRKEGARGHLKK